MFSQGSALVFLTLVLKGAIESRIDRQDLWKRSISSLVFKRVEGDSITETVESALQALENRLGVVELIILERVGQAVLVWIEDAQCQIK